MKEVLIWIEHHPAITSLITAILIGLFAIIGWFINLNIGKKLKGTEKTTDEVIAALAVELKKLEYLLKDFNNFTVMQGNYIKFKYEIELFMEKFTAIAALFSVHKLSLYSKYEDLRNILREILSVRLAMDGGRSFRRLNDLVSDAKKLTNDIVHSLGELL